MMTKNLSEEYMPEFLLGTSVAQNMLKGILHPDMKLENMGISISKNFKVCDYAEIQKFSIPEDLNSEMLTKLSISLFPLLADLPESFLARSKFRAGFTAQGGGLGQAIFQNLVNYGFSSNSYLNNTTNFLVKPFDINSYTDNEEFLQGIQEWTMLPFEDINIRKYDTLEKYKTASIRQNVSAYNQYFLDRLYLLKSYIWFLKIKDIKSAHIALLNLGNIALINGYIYIAYGLLKKCTLISDHSSTSSSSKKILNRMTRQYNVLSPAKRLIDTNIDRDALELLWLLEEIQFLY